MTTTIKNEELDVNDIDLSTIEDPEERARVLFTQWHMDEAVDEAEASAYAEQLIEKMVESGLVPMATRLPTGASGEGVRKSRKYKRVRGSKTDQRIFQDEAGNIYLCDQSGNYPDETDDGPLRVNIPELLHRGLVCQVNSGEGIYFSAQVNKEQYNDRLCSVRFGIGVAQWLADHYQLELKIIVGGVPFVRS